MAAWFLMQNQLQGVQTAFLHKNCGRLPVGNLAVAMLAELAEDPCSLRWWAQRVRVAARITDLPYRALRPFEIIRRTPLVGPLHYETL